MNRESTMIMQVLVNPYCQKRCLMQVTLKQVVNVLSENLLAKMFKDFITTFICSLIDTNLARTPFNEQL